MRRGLELDPDDIHRLALAKWGYTAQRDIWVEEMAELTQELMKYGRQFNPSTKDDIVKELVDVMLCVEQMILHFSDGRNIQERHKIAFERFTRLVLEDTDNRTEAVA